MQAGDSIRSQALTVLRDGVLGTALVALHSALWLRNSLGWTLAWLWTAISYATKHKGKSLDCIAGDAKELSKIPGHLAMVVQEEAVSCDDLARLAMWAFASNIRVVSLYDPYGNIMKDIVSLRHRLQHHHRQLFTPPLPDIQVSTSREAAAEGHTGSSYQVLVLSPEDGQHNMVETAVGVCQSVMEKGVAIEQVDLDLINSRIAGTQCLPDPQMALVFGPMCCTVGYPPWQLRLTEIHTISTHHKVPYQQFLQVLQRYSRCQQRCGK